MPAHPECIRPANPQAPTSPWFARQIPHAYRRRISQARERSQRRQGKPNVALDAAEVSAHCVLDEPAHRFAHQAAERLGWSARSLHRMLKVARSVADLAGSATLGLAHVAEAMQYRRGLPAAGQ